MITNMQAPIKCVIYMRLPVGMEVQGGTAETSVLKMLKNLYGGRQVRRVWAVYLTEKLMEADFLHLM